MEYYTKSEKYKYIIKNLKILFGINPYKKFPKSMYSCVKHVCIELDDLLREYGARLTIEKTDENYDQYWTGRGSMGVLVHKDLYDYLRKSIIESV